MSNIWFISDTHFNHEKFLSFKDDDGKQIRPFSSVEEMDEAMIDNWNRVVKDGDKVYHLGDFTMNPKKVKLFADRLKGSKRLIIGNHDLMQRNSQYYDAFKKIMLWRLFKSEGFIATHIPLKKSQMRHAVVNAQGHIHDRKMKSPIYFNCCVEHHDYTPIPMDVILDHVRYVKQLDYENLNDD